MWDYHTHVGRLSRWRFFSWFTVKNPRSHFDWRGGATHRSLQVAILDFQILDSNCILNGILVHMSVAALPWSYGLNRPYLL
jgi:hypothetical protein